MIESPSLKGIGTVREVDEINLLLPNGTVGAIKVNGLHWVPFKIQLGNRYIKFDIQQSLLFCVDYIIMIPVRIDQISLLEIDGIPRDTYLKIAVDRKYTKTFHLDPLEGCLVDYNHQSFPMNFITQNLDPGSHDAYKAIQHNRRLVLSQYRDMIHVALSESKMWRLCLEHPKLQPDAMLDSLNDGLNLGRLSEYKDPSRFYFIVHVDTDSKELTITKYANRVKLPKFNEL